MNEVEQIKREIFEAIKGCKLLMVVETEDGFTVHQWHPDGVAPTSTYDTNRKAAARLLQLLHIGPVAPQTWPETACIGTIDAAPPESQL
jgi:hypothetical protein